jgi:hypothetical protein
LRLQMERSGETLRWATMPAAVSAVPGGPVAGSTGRRGVVGGLARSPRLSVADARSKQPIRCASETINIKKITSR